MCASTQSFLKKITPEEKLLFACTRQSFEDAHRQTVLEICRHYQINWGWVLKTATLHGVAPLIYVNLQRCPLERLGLPQAVAELFRQSLLHNMLVKQRKAANLVRALSFFEQKSIKVMLTKGVALDVMVYDQPYYTVLADFDLILSIRRAEISDETHRAHMQFLHQSGLEFDYFEHHDVMMNGVLPIDFKSIWDNSTSVDYRGREVWMMSPEDLLLSVCINSCRKRFLRLKSLCDIAETVGKFPGIDWNRLVRRAKAFDCHNIVYTALLVTKMTVDCKLPDNIFSHLAINPIRAKIIHNLSSHMSLSAYTSLRSNRSINLFDRRIDWALSLPYATFRWYQVWRRIRFVLTSPGNGRKN